MIHPSAVVDPGASLAGGVEVGPFAFIGADVRIGRGTRIGPHSVIRGPTEIGEDNRIFQFASVGEEPQDKKYNGEPTRLILGDRNVVRESATIHRGTIQDQSETRIGNDNLFMAYSHIAHDCIVGNHCIFANGSSLAGHVEVGDYAILGGFALVHQFTHIGTRAFCGMGSVITRDIPPFSTAAGGRAKVIGINKEGLRRNGFSPELIRALHKSFRELLKSKAPKQDVFKDLEPLCDEYPEVEMFVNFIRNSERGIASR